MRDNEKKKDMDWHLILMLFLASAFVMVWVSYQYYSYSHFLDSFWDIGQETYSMSLHLHYAYLLGGLQFLSFSNHISPFKVLLLPIFALAQNPMTLVLIQEISLAIAAIALYFIGRDIAGSRPFGLAMGIAFLANPGITGVVFYDLHVEAFIPLFYLLSFYFYMKERRIGFIASYALMLSTIETSIFPGITFILGILFYEFVYARKKPEASMKGSNRRIGLLIAAFAITVAFALFYLYAIGTLISAYGSGGYQGMPPDVRVFDFLSTQAKALQNLGGVQYNFYTYMNILEFGFVVVYLGFGITSVRNLLMTTIFVSIWVVEYVILHNVIFGTFYNHYFAYVIGGAAVAAVLGYIVIMEENRMKFFWLKVEQIPKFAIWTALTLGVISAITLAVGVIGLGGIPLGSHFPNDTAIGAVLGSIPPNSVVMAQPSVSAHLYEILYLELPPDYVVSAFTPNGFEEINISTFYAKPEYIVMDKQLPDFNSTMDNPDFDVYGYLAGNYTLYYSGSGLEAYRLSR